MVESQPSKLLVASSILVSRSMFSVTYGDFSGSHIPFVVLANSDLIDKVGFVLIPSILAGESIVSHLRVTIGGVPQSCSSPV